MGSRTQMADRIALAYNCPVADVSRLAYNESLARATLLPLMCLANTEDKQDATRALGHVLGRSGRLLGFFREFCIKQVNVSGGCDRERA